MTVTPRLRKLALTAHVTASVGWLGAVVVFLALSVAGLTSQDPQTVRGAYLAMELAGWVVLVPLSLASLVTGLVCALGSIWGLFRHYWVLFKLVINVVASIVLLLVATALAIYKPRGMTRYGQRTQQQRRALARSLQRSHSTS